MTTPNFCTMTSSPSTPFRMPSISIIRNIRVALVGLLVAGCSRGPLPSTSGMTPAHAPAASSQRTTSASASRQDPELITGRLPNGLTYYIRSNPFPAKRANLWLAVNAGSINEDDDQRGFAHFLEHMAFNGTTHFPGNTAIDLIERAGMNFGADVNAYTSFEETVYQLTIPTDDRAIFRSGLQILDDWASGRMLMDSSEVVAERGVVLGEWRMRLPDTASTRFQMDQMAREFGEGSLFAKRFPIGDPKLLKTATAAPIARFYHDWYRPDLMAVIVVGDFNAKEVEHEILERFRGLPTPTNPRKFERPVVTPSSETVVYSVADKMQPHVEFTWLAPPLADDPATALRQEIIDQLSTSFLQRTFTALSKKERRSFALGTIARTDGATRHSQDRMTMQIWAFPDSLMGAFRIALTEVERVAQHGIPAAVLEGDKQALRRQYMGYSDGSASITSRTYAQMYTQHYLTGKGELLGPNETFVLVEQILPTISSTDIAQNVQRWRTETGRVATVMQMYGYPVAKVPVADMKTMLRDVASQSLSTQSLADGLFGSPTTVKDVSNAASPAASSVTPTAGTVVSTQHFAKADLTEWTLSNGARVVYKRNPSQPDHFLMKAYSLGGSSVMPDSVFGSPGRLVGMLMTASGGLSGVDHETLAQERRTTGLREFHVGINAFDEDIVIGGSPRELESLFQQLYLQFTAPTVDTMALADWRRNGMQQASYMSSNDRLALNASGNRRLVGPSLAGTPFVDLAQAMRVYYDRFGDASDFTFYLVGPSKPSDILPLVTEYVASLPSTNRTVREVPRDFHIPVMTGKGEGGGTNPNFQQEQSYVSLTFAGKIPADSTKYLDGMQELSSASWILGRRLRNLLREKMGVTYSASAPYSQYWTPDPRYFVSISMMVDPTVLDTTTEAILNTVDVLRKEGPTDEELTMAMTVRTHQLENARQRNTWWIDQLEALDRVGVPYSYLEHAHSETSLTKERVREAVNKYFPKKTYQLIKTKPARERTLRVQNESSSEESPREDRTNVTK